MTTGSKDGFGAGACEAKGVTAVGNGSYDQNDLITEVLHIFLGGLSGSDDSSLTPNCSWRKVKSMVIALKLLRPTD